MQLRDIAGFVDTRATILQLKPGTKSHWISFAIAQHLNGSHDIAAEALKKYEGLQVREYSHPILQSSSDIEALEQRSHVVHYAPGGVWDYPHCLTCQPVVSKP